MRQLANFQNTAVPDRALTRRQAAAVMARTQKALANLAHRGEGPPVRKAGGRCVYLESELMQYLHGLPIVGGQEPGA